MGEAGGVGWRAQGALWRSLFSIVITSASQSGSKRNYYITDYVFPRPACARAWHVAHMFFCRASHTRSHQLGPCKNTENLEQHG